MLFAAILHRKRFHPLVNQLAALDVVKPDAKQIGCAVVQVPVCIESDADPGHCHHHDKRHHTRQIRQKTGTVEKCSEV